ncbi:MAG: dockerin type I domain-containing protein [Pirellulales bacterium]
MTTVSQSSLGGQVKQLDDGRVEYTPPPTSSDTSSEFGFVDSFNYTVTTKDGRSSIGVVFVTVLPVDDPQTAGKAALSVDVKDDAGDPVTSISAGSEFWVELSSQDLRTDPQGIYAAFFDVQFDTSAFEVVGDAEAMGTFVNGRTGTHGEGGWKDLGGFTDSTTPFGAGPQSVVRFRLRALRDDALTISVSPATGSAQETLLFGSNVPVTRSNISSSIVTIPAFAEVSGDAALLATLERFDVNGDDRLSPLDVLLVINRINAVMQGTSIASLSDTDSAGEDSDSLDVNVDGKISPLDALVIINQLNSSSESVARLLSPSTTPWIDISVLRAAVTTQAAAKSTAIAISGEGESAENATHIDADSLSNQVIGGNVQSAASWSSAVNHTLAESETFEFDLVESRSRSSRSIRNSLASRN